LLSADIALAPLVEDWVENYQSTANDEVSERAAVHELILFVVRACGLAADVTEDEAMDVDGVLDAVETIQDESVRVSSLDMSDMKSSSSTGRCRFLPSHIESKGPQAIQEQSRSLHFTPHQNYGHFRYSLRRNRNNLPHHSPDFHPSHLAQHNVFLPSKTYPTYIDIYRSQDCHRAMCPSWGYQQGVEFEAEAEGYGGQERGRWTCFPEEDEGRRGQGQGGPW